MSNQLRRAIQSLQLSTDQGRHEWLEAMINQIPDYIYAKDLEGRILFANEAVLRDNGLTALDQLLGKTDFDLHPYEAAHKIATVERQVIETGEPDLGIEEVALGSEDRWLMMSRLPLRDMHGHTIGVVGMSRDITARKKAEQLMQAQARLLELVATGIALDQVLSELILMIEGQADGISGSVMMKSEDGQYLTLVSAPSLSEIYKQRIPRVPIGPEAGSCGTAAWRNAPVTVTDIANDPLWRNHLHLVEGVNYKACWSTPIRSSRGEVLGTFALYSPKCSAPDARLNELIGIAAHLAGIAIERRKTEEHVRFLATHDGLTRLPNRRSMDQALEAALVSAKEDGTSLALAFLDLDNFKLVNDTLGHAAGDDLLKAVAGRIEREIGPDGVVGRIGGDEFVILVKSPAIDPPGSMSRFESLRKSVAEPLPLNGMVLEMSCSMGVATYPQHGSDAATLLAHADAAMYQAKEAGRDSLKLFSFDMAERTRRKLAGTEDMRRALRENEFLLHFQPQLNRRSGKIVGVEALVRWQHPTRGLISPAEFIPLAEDNGLIVSLGRWILREACRQCRRWLADAEPGFRVSVNVSARQFKERAIVADVEAALSDSGLSPQNLELEITESLIMQDLPLAIELMSQLAAMGVTLSIDDFGTGYSSLAALKRFPVSKLKIDQSFIADIPGDPDSVALTSAIITIARKLGLQIIAEGVETEDQVKFLLESGCDHVQGYIVSRPLPAAEVSAFINGSAPDVAAFNGLEPKAPCVNSVAPFRCSLRLP